MASALNLPLSKSIQRGFTLIEISIVLIVFGVIAAAAMGGMSLYSTSKNDAESKRINMIIESIKVKMARDATTAGLSNLTVINSGVLAKQGWANSISGGTGLIGHSMHGAVTFAPATISGLNDAISLTMSSLPFLACSDIARDMTAHAEQITIGATVVQSSSGAPASGSLIDTTCGTTGTQNVTAVYMKLQ